MCRQFIIGAIGMIMAVTACSSPSTTALGEEEFIKLLGEAAQQGPVVFRTQTWPLLEKKLFSYCGRADEVRIESASAIVLITVEKTTAGKPIPWRLEGKTDALDQARQFQPGESLCMTGTLESFTERLDQYWGHVKMTSLAKSAAS